MYLEIMRACAESESNSERLAGARAGGTHETSETRAMAGVKRGQGSWRGRCPMQNVSREKRMGPMLDVEDQPEPWSCVAR